MNGIFSALLGVFNADGDINEDGVRALVRHNIDKCGIDGLYVNGSTGETFLMTMEIPLFLKNRSASAPPRLRQY